MAAPDPQKPTQAPNPDAKLQAKLGAGRNTAAAVIVGKKGERTIIDDKVLKSENATLYIGNCEECDFIVTGACTKILVESCKKSRITLNGRIATNVLEIWKCEDMVSLVNTRVSTIQADMCKKLNVEFTKKELYNQLVWAAVHDLTLSFRDAAEHRLETGFAQMKEKHPDLKEETDQFYVRFINNVLLQELMIRLPGGYPSTEREAAFFEAEAKRRDEHMRREAEKLIKFVPKKFLKSEQEKVGRNDKCTCGSGKKYKNCCGVPTKKEEEKKEGDAPAANAKPAAADAAAAAPAATTTPPAATPAPAQP